MDYIAYIFILRWVFPLEPEIMIPSNEHGRIRRWSGRPCRRTVFVFLCFSVAYALFHFVARDTLDITSNLYEEETGGMNGYSPEPALFLLGPGGPSSSTLNLNSGAESPSSPFGLTMASTSTSRSTWTDSEDPLVDKETKTVEDLILEAARTIRNIPHPPFILGKKEGGPKFYRNASCARFPTVYDLEFSNTFWQVSI